MVSSISFQVRSLREGDSPLEFVPVVDGITLTDRIHAFEFAAKMETRPASYAGLIPEFARFGTARAHYFATRESPVGRLNEDGKIPLLRCECGEWGCWPLEADVALTDATVTWTEFRQPFRPNRDYSAFGPFVFDRAEYTAAIAAVEELWRHND